MRYAGRVDFRNGKRIVALVGAPPRGTFGADVISLRFQRGPRWRKADSGVYMTPDEAAWTVTVLGHALQRVTTKLRPTFAHRAARQRPRAQRARP